MRPIDPRIPTVVVWVALVGALIVWHEPLRWAAASLPEYLAGDVGAPVERSLYREARASILEGGDLDRAEAMLERALAIDPTCEAGYWLAVLRDRRGEAARALEAYRRYLAIDPTMLDAWTAAVRLERQAGRRERALELARRGLAFFEREVELQRPRRDPAVGSRYNEKAVESFGAYRDGVRRLRALVAELELTPAAPSG